MELEKFLDNHKIWHEFIEKKETIHTADAAAAVFGIALNRISKSLVLFDENKNCILVIIPGDSKLSFNKIKDVLGVKKVRLVPFEDAENYSGYLPGATPMVHHKIAMISIVDKKLLEYDVIYGGGGTRTKLLGLKINDVIKLNNAIISDITE